MDDETAPPDLDVHGARHAEVTGALSAIRETQTAIVDRLHVLESRVDGLAGQVRADVSDVAGDTTGAVENVGHDTLATGEAVVDVPVGTVTDEPKPERKPRAAKGRRYGRHH